MNMKIQNESVRMYNLYLYRNFIKKDPIMRLIFRDSENKMDINNMVDFYNISLSNQRKTRMVIIAKSIIKRILEQAKNRFCRDHDFLNMLFKPENISENCTTDELIHIMNNSITECANDNNSKSTNMMLMIVRNILEQMLVFNLESFNISPVNDENSDEIIKEIKDKIADKNTTANADETDKIDIQSIMDRINCEIDKTNNFVYIPKLCKKRKASFIEEKSNEEKSNKRRKRSNTEKTESEDIMEITTGDDDYDDQIDKYDDNSDEQMSQSSDKDAGNTIQNDDVILEIDNESIPDNNNVNEQTAIRETDLQIDEKTETRCSADDVVEQSTGSEMVDNGFELEKHTSINRVLCENLKDDDNNDQNGDCKVVVLPELNSEFVKIEEIAVEQPSFNEKENMSDDDVNKTTVDSIVNLSGAQEDRMSESVDNQLQPLSNVQKEDINGVVVTEERDEGNNETDRQDYKKDFILRRPDIFNFKSKKRLPKLFK